MRQKYLLRGGVTMIGMGGYHESVQGGTMDRYIQSNDIIEVKNQVKSTLDILWQSVGANECPANEFKKVFDKFSIL